MPGFNLYLLWNLPQTSGRLTENHGIEMHLEFSLWRVDDMVSGSEIPAQPPPAHVWWAPLTSALSKTSCLTPSQGSWEDPYLNTNAVHIFSTGRHPSCYIFWTKKKNYWQVYSSLGTQTIAFLFHTPWIYASNSRWPWNISFYSRLPISLTVFQLTSDYEN